MTFSEFYEELANTSSTAKKVWLLKDTVGCYFEDELKFYFYNALNPELNFYIKKIPDYKPNAEGYKGFTDRFKTVLNNLARRVLSGNKARDAVQECLSEMSPEYAKLSCNILLKDPKCGVSVKTFSKVYPDVIPEKPKLCKANSFSKKNISYIRYPAISQRKADGARVLVFTGDYDGEPRIVSSNGNPITCLPSLSEFVKSHFPLNYVIDGELVFMENGKAMERKKGNGLVSKCILNTLPPEMEKQAKIYAWDIIPEDVYKGLEPSDTCLARYLYLGELCSKVSDKEHRYIEAIETKMVYNFTEAFDHFSEMVKQGEEGIILKNANSLWEGKRIKDCCKFKIAIQNTLKVTGFEYGDKNSKYSGMLGALTCESSDGIIKVKVGSGFSDEERKSITPENSIGKCIEVVSNGIIEATTNNGREYSLFLPRFIEFRDKNEADSFDTIKLTVEGSKLLTEKKRK